MRSLILDLLATIHMVLVVVVLVVLVVVVVEAVAVANVLIGVTFQVVFSTIDRNNKRPSINMVFATNDDVAMR